MNKHLAFALLAILYPLLKLIYLNTIVAVWMIHQLMKPMSKLFYYTYGEKLNYENGNRN